MLLFATERYQELCQDIAGAGDFDLGVVERKVFPDEERYRRIESDCATRDVALVGGRPVETTVLKRNRAYVGPKRAEAGTLTVIGLGPATRLIVPPPTSSPGSHEPLWS